MATINFNTQQLADIYLHGNGSTDAGGHLVYFRNNTTAELQSEIASLDNRIATFQNAIVDSAKTGSEESPYDAAFLKREFMEEVFAIMMKRSEYRRTDLQIKAGILAPPFNAVDGNNLLTTAVNTTDGFRWDGGNFSNMSYDDMRHYLDQNNGALPTFNAYMALIDAVFAEGNKMKNNPIDPASTQTVVSGVTTAITARVIDGRTYDRVTFDGTDYYLVQAGASTSVTEKMSSTGYLANSATGTVSTGPAANSYVGFSTAPSNATFLKVDKNLNVLSSTPIVSPAPQQRLMSPMEYLYYWTEARIRIMRGQLNMKEAITSEIRDDLAKANKAFADLEKQAALVRADPDATKSTLAVTSSETQTLDFFEATNSAKGTQLFDGNGGDDIHNYGEWGSNRSNLKTYIDRKSTESQNAMLDYQTTLNRFNNAYEVMSKLQEKMDGLVKGQLRNVG